MTARRVEVILALDPSQYVAGGARAVSTNRQIESSVDKVNTTARRAAGGTKQFGDDSVRGFSRSAVAAALMEGNISKVATTAAGFFAGAVFIRGTQAIVAGVRRVITAGMDMNETLSKTRFAFGSGAEIIIAQADQMADKFGTNKQEFIDSATVIGLIGKAAGESEPRAAALGTSFAKLAADVSSFHNVPVADALAAIQSGLVGEAEPLRRYGVLLSEAAVQSEAVRLGISRSGGELTEQQKVMARASLIQQGFADASGDLARTQDSLANRFRASQGHVANFAADLGTKAQPALEAVLSGAYRLGHDGLDVLSVAAEHLAPFFGDLVQTGRNLGPILSAVASVAGPVATGFSAIVGTGVLGVLNALGFTLQATTGFLADHKVIVQAVAAAYIGSLIPALVTSTQLLAANIFARASIGAFQLAGIVDNLGASLLGGARYAGVASIGMTEVAGSATAAAASGGALFGVLEGIGGALSVVSPAIFVATAVSIVSSLDDVDQQAKKTKKTLEGIGGTQSFEGFEARLAAIRAEIKKQAPAAAEYERDTNIISGALDRMTGGVDSSVGALKGAKQELKATSAEYARLRHNVGAVADATGLSTEQILAMAVANGVDLVNGGRAAVAVLRAYAAAAGASTNASDNAKVAAETLSKALQGVKSPFETLQVAGVDQFVQISDQRAKASAKAAKAGETAEQMAIKLARAAISEQRAQWGVVDAERELARVRDELARGVAVINAERAVADAYRNSVRAVLAVIDAERALEDERLARVSGRTIQQAEFAVARARDAAAQAAEDLLRAEDKLFLARDHGTDIEISESERERDEVLRKQTEAAWALSDAELALQRAQQDNGQGRGVVQAELDLAEARQRVAEGTDAERQTAVELAQVRADGGARQLADAELGLKDALLGVREAQEQANAAHSKGEQALGSVETAADRAKSSLQGFIDVLGENLKAAAEWDKNLVVAAQRGGAGVAAAFNKLGPEYAGALQELVRASDTSFNKGADIAITAALRGTEGFNTITRAGWGDATAIAAIGSGAVAQSIATELGTTVDVVKKIMQDYFVSIGSPLAALLSAVGKTITITTSGQQITTLPSGDTLIRGGRAFAQGGVDAHIVDRPTVLYGERSTKREAFVPQAGISPAQAHPILSEAAGWHGFAVVPMARGGVTAYGSTVPGSPSLTPRYGAVGYSAEAGADTFLDALETYVHDHPRRGGDGASAVPYGGGGRIGQGWRSITGYLDAIGAQYIVTSTTGGHHVPGSKHYEGKAADLVGRGRWSMLDIFNALGPSGGNPLKGIDELFYDPPGFYYDRGARRSGRIGGHGDHVHAATFDDGYGYLDPGVNLAYNGTGAREYLRPAQAMPSYPAAHGAAGLAQVIQVEVAANAMTWEFRGPLVFGSMKEAQAMMLRTAKEATAELTAELVAALEQRGV